MTLTIGNIELENPFVLAPLAGVTDAAMRRICRRQGASLVFSEMISCKGLIYGDKNTERLLKIYREEKPVALQIFGSEPSIVGEAADMLKDRENCILDINMGCPVPKVVKNGEGSALLKNPDLVGKLIEAMVKYAGKPVTAKIRTGWDDTCINAIEVAKIIESAGASAVAIHGRTRQQYYSGKANWNIIGETKVALNIPVIGNGDVFEAEDAIEMLQYTGCDCVMIARGAQGNPWIFREALALWNGQPKTPPPSLEERVSVMQGHLEDLIELKGEYCAVREMRKHTGWYLKGIHGASAIKRYVNQIDDASELMEALSAILKDSSHGVH